MAFTFTVTHEFLVSDFTITFPSFSYLRVRRNSDSSIVLSVLLSSKPALRVQNGKYQIGTFSTQDPVFIRDINLGFSGKKLEIGMDSSGPCLLGTTNIGVETVTFKYKLTLCPVEIWRVNSSVIRLTSPHCQGQSGCGNCFSQS